MVHETPARLSADRYREHIEEESRRFAEALAAGAGSEPVAACPGWSLDELARHLGQVQRFWARIAADRLTTENEIAELTSSPDPDDTAGRDRAALLADGRAASAELVAALAKLDPEEPLWSWSSDRTAGFALRRQAHEALIHRLDAQYAVAPDGSRRSPIDAMLAADGIAEALDLRHATYPDWAQVTPQDDRIVRLVASDVGLSWLLTLARRTGTDPQGREHDDPAIVVTDDPGDGTVRPAAILAGTAEDLDTWLWQRPVLGDLHRTGDATLLAQVEAALARPPA